ncbi:phosphotransferase family protein [Henriciella sp. AS95]|uniref:phosphotransferase family protein n=1 Tax=Henriciella sp. AS95 TaxID=3135782 RepID=UPI00316FC945
MRLVDVEYGLEVFFFPLIVAKMSDAQDFERRLSAVVAKIYDGKAELNSAEQLSGGASQETWLLKLAGSLVPDSIILRRAPEGATATSELNPIGLAREAEVIALASDADVPVPKVLRVLTPTDGLGEGFFMSRITGETIARRILRDDQYATARAVLPEQCGMALARIHSVKGASDCGLEESSGLDQLRRYDETYRSTGICRPIFDLAVAWLEDHAPSPLKPALVHGDFRLGNIMVDEQGLASVLDWELSHIGDPREDIAWLCVNSWRFGQSENRVGGFGQLEDLLDAYEQAGGQAFQPTDIDWWEILGSLKWGIMCMMMYESFRSGADPSVERAAIGRRVSETEIDLINLLERQ